jgi:hypothetical protein
MSRIIFESSPLYLSLCILLSGALSFLLYKAKSPWSKNLNKLLFAFRFVLLFFLSLLLLGPIIKQINNLFEKPVIVLVQDDSRSIREVLDSTRVNLLTGEIKKLQEELVTKGYEVEVRALSESRGGSDFTKTLKNISTDYENKKIAGAVLVSDGIYNEGVSPLYATFNFPVHTVGVGDTIERTDIFIKNVLANKVAYEGNRFPMQAFLQAKGFENREVEVILKHKGKEIERKHVLIKNENFTQVEFFPSANEQGIQRYEVLVSPKPNEWNTSNNRATVFVEVVAGKKKILAIAAAPHPDVKALRAVIDQNPNYEYTLYIPGVTTMDMAKLQAEADLIMLFQLPDAKGRNRSLFQQLLKAKASLFLVLGAQTDWAELMRGEVVSMEALPRQYDDVTPVVNSAFSIFSLSEEVTTTFNTFPPASVPFTKMQISPAATPLLFQKVGSVVTEKPLLYIEEEEARKVAVMLGEGLWRWRLHEYARNENTEAFDEVFSKLLQYLTTTDDRRKFRCYPVQQQFSDTEPVQFETQVYNEIFEPVYGNTIEIELIDETGQRTNYKYTTGVGNTRYSIGGLTEGVYRFKAFTTLKVREEVRGEFLVVKQQLEMQNLTADFNLLRKLSSQTGGVFYKIDQVEKLKTDLLQKEAVASIHTEEKLNTLVSLKWIFFFLLLLISTEWFLRKYSGGY